MISRRTCVPRSALLSSVWLTGAVGLISLAIALSTDTAFAQEDGHEEGAGHTGEPGGSGGHGGGGEGGHGGGGEGGHGGTAVDPVVDAAVTGDGNSSVAMTPQYQPSASPGTYMRFELGGARNTADDANWLPPGYPGDPQVFFDLDMDNTSFAALAIGHDYGGGWRADVSLNMFGRSSFSGPWSYTVPATPGPHATMEGSVRSTALMANGYYDFDLGSKVRPFVTAGIGVGKHSMNWSRIDPAGDTRSFERSSKASVAWSVGLGASIDVGPIIGKHPATLELAWRYFDLGKAKGSEQSITGGGGGGAGPAGVPAEPLNFDVTNQVVSIGLRIPLN